MDVEQGVYDKKGTRSIIDWQQILAAHKYRASLSEISTPQIPIIFMKAGKLYISSNLSSIGWVVNQFFCHL